MRRRQAVGIAALLVVGGLAGAYAGAWRWAAGETARTLDDWMAREARVGRHWTCPDRTISGFPTRITVACLHPRFEGEIAERAFTGTLGGFTAEAGVLHPRTLEATLASPFALGATDQAGGALTLSWTRLGVELAGLPAGIQGTGFVADGLTVAGDVAGWGHLEGAADRMAVAIEARAGRPDAAYDARLTLEGGRIPLLDAIMGGAAPTTAAFMGTVNRVDFAASGDVAARLDAWRTAGGRLEITGLRLQHGTASVGGTGAFAIDGAHRPEGRLDARFAGLEPVLRRFGVDPGLVAATGLIGSLLGGNRNAGRPDDGGGLRLPVTLSGGRVTVGPVRTPLAVPPLY